MRRTVVRGGEEERSGEAEAPIVESPASFAGERRAAAAPMKACRKTSRSSIRAANPGVIWGAQHDAGEAFREVPVVGAPGS